MRWKTVEKGDVRNRKAFLFFPLRIGDETRWLEVAEWREEFKHIADGWWGWYPVAWL